MPSLVWRKGVGITQVNTLIASKSIKNKRLSIWMTEHGAWTLQWQHYEELEQLGNLPEAIRTLKHDFIWLLVISYEYAPLSLWHWKPVKISPCKLPLPTPSNREWLPWWNHFHFHENTCQLISHYEQWDFQSIVKGSLKDLKNQKLFTTWNIWYSTLAQVSPCIQMDSMDNINPRIWWICLSMAMTTYKYTYVLIENVEFLTTLPFEVWTKYWDSNQEGRSEWMELLDI